MDRLITKVFNAAAEGAANTVTSAAATALGQNATCAKREKESDQNRNFAALLKYMASGKEAETAEQASLRKQAGLLEKQAADIKKFDDQISPLRIAVERSSFEAVRDAMGDTSAFVPARQDWGTDEVIGGFGKADVEAPHYSRKHKKNCNILGVPYDATLYTMEAAYLKHSRECHFTCGSRILARRKFQKVKQAYEELKASKEVQNLDTGKRKASDRAPARLAQTGKNGSTALDIAIEQGNPEQATEFVSSGALVTPDMVDRALRKALEITLDKSFAATGNEFAIIDNDSGINRARVVYALLESNVIPAEKTIKFAMEQGQPNWAKTLSDTRDQNIRLAARRSSPAAPVVAHF